MPQTIYTNIASLNTQRHLNRTEGGLTTTLERLSSGLRINTAKDDAAGLSISERMSTQIRGMNQAIRNANDGISLTRAGEGALAELNNNLQRIRELAVQSANDTNSSSDRAALDLEAQQLLQEIDRVATQTSFNGRNILDGTFGNATFQVGHDVGQTITLNLSTSMRTTSIGKTADYVGGVAYNSALAVGQQGASVSTNDLAAGDLTIALGSGQASTIGASTVGPEAGQTTASAYSKAAAINAAGIGGLTATANTTVEFAWAGDIVAGTPITDAYSSSINGQAIYTATESGSDGTAVASAINANASATGVTAVYDGTNMTLTAVDGRDILINQLGLSGNSGTGLGNPTATGNNNADNETKMMALGVQYSGSIRLTAAETINIGGTGTPANAGLSAGSLALGAAALSSVDVTTVANSNTTIGRVDAALTTISNLRSTFGAIQNRFGSVVSSLATTSENISAARSAIRDADYAAETAELSRVQVLKQAAIAMLTQANASPQNILALLQ